MGMIHPDIRSLECFDITFFTQRFLGLMQQAKDVALSWDTVHRRGTVLHLHNATFKRHNRYIHPSASVDESKESSEIDRLVDFVDIKAKIYKEIAQKHPVDLKKAADGIQFSFQCRPNDVDTGPKTTTTTTRQSTVLQCSIPDTARNAPYPIDGIMAKLSCLRA